MKQEIIEQIKKMPGVKLISSAAGDNAYTIIFEPETKPLFTNSLEQKFFNGDAIVWFFSKHDYGIDKCYMNDIIGLSEDERFSEIYKTEADAYRQMVEYASRQGKELLYIDKMKPFGHYEKTETPIFHWDYYDYRIAEEKAIEYERYTMEDDVEFLRGEWVKSKNEELSEKMIVQLSDVELKWLFNYYTHMDGKVIGKEKKV